MKQIFLFLVFLPLLGCSSLLKNKATSKDFNCPSVFFSSEDRVYIDNAISLDEVTIKAEFNNFAINNKCQYLKDVAVIPLNILIVAKPMSNSEKPNLSLPIYVSLLDTNNDVIETQYFSLSFSMNRDALTKKLIETDIKDRIQIVTKNNETTQLVIGFMLDNRKRDLLD
tara:strand:+ start:1013 stop:1519 length:507 start_codon:yes stop_codon:yes gene_type:complete